jgi:hypothetical protein
VSAPKDTGAGTLAALPLAAALVVVLARWLPIRFEYHENPLGIVSWATLNRYPLQQETFWLVFSAVAVTLCTWLLARRLARAAGGRSAPTVEALGAFGLVAALWLPDPAGALMLGVATAAALGLVAGAPEPAAAPAVQIPLAPSPSRIGLALGVAALALLSALLTPGFWVGLWTAAVGTADSRFVTDYFNFHAEAGQHLAWADAIRRGGLHGRDFFCLYGPLYDLSLVGLWALLGRSIAVWVLFAGSEYVAGYTIALLLCAALLRRRALVLLFPVIAPFVHLRIGLALAGLLGLIVWRRTGRRRWSFAAGVFAGISLLYSQEFGLALAVAASLGFGVAREARAAALFAAGVAGVFAPMLGWFALHDALAPMLHDVAAYPGYMIAGYGKLPFPSLVAQLPLDLALLLGFESLEVRLAYAVPCIVATALLLCVPLAALRAKRLPAWLRDAADALAADPRRFGVMLVAVFGALAFRTALGRSDIKNTLVALAPAAVLLVVAVDSLVAVWRSDRPRRPLLATRAAALLIFAWHGGLLEAGAPFSTLAATYRTLTTLATRGFAPPGDARVLEVTRWVTANTEEGEPVLFLPNNAAYYYLTQRPSPIRFVLGHQIVTEAHRAEVLRTLRRRPPRFIVWDTAATRVDRVEDVQVFGARLLVWIQQKYVEETRIGATTILRLRKSAPPKAP